MSEDEGYQRGLVDGRLKSLEDIVRQQAQEVRELRVCIQQGFKERDRQIGTLSKALWAFGGAVTIIQFAPILRDFLA